MASVVVEQSHLYRVENVATGRYFKAPGSGAVHIKINDGSVRLEDGMYFDDLSLSDFGPAYFIPKNDAIHILV